MSLRTIGDQLEREVRARLVQANTWTAAAELAGEFANENYYYTIQDELREIVERVNQLSKLVAAHNAHAHQWNDNDYCDVCGADGRA